jgi:cell division initiation protein
MAKITVVDIQHKTFKKALQGYERTEVDQFLDEIIETLEDEAQMRAALEGEVSDLKERISHFKAMEESLQSTLLLAQRTADEVKAAAHKEADLIRQEARISAEREIDARRDEQRARDTAEKAKSELRSLLMSHLSLIDRGPLAVAQAAAPAEAPVAPTPPPAAPAAEPAPSIDARPTIKSETDELAQLPFNGTAGHRIVE